MTQSYQAVQWNRHKRIYVMAMMASVMIFNVCFVVLTQLWHPAPHDLGPPPILMMRSTASCAFLMLNVILMIGPLARLSPKFAPLLYNRRHLGVAMFAVALVHSILATLVYHGMGNGNPILGIFTDNTRYDSLAHFPFQVLGFSALLILFLMAATSHDYWLKNLGSSAWKTLHMLVYVAYALLVMHVTLGVLQSEMHPAYVVLTGTSVVAVGGLHLWAGLREYRTEASGRIPGEWMQVGRVEDISPNRALVVALKGAERVAVFRHDDMISAVTNVCAHQGGPLGEGKIVDGCLTCPWHGYQYLVDKGQSPPPFTEKIATYRVKLVGQEILLNPSPLTPGTPVEPARIQTTEDDSDGE